MTLYSKWSISKNIMFLSGIVMIICLFATWFSKSNLQEFDLGMADSYFKQWKDYKELLDEESLKQIKPIYYTFKLNQFRFLLFIPLIYPFFCLFKSKYIKDLCCLSALVNVIASIAFLVIGKEYCSIRVWIFAIFAVIFFLATTVSSPLIEGNTSDKT